MDHCIYLEVSWSMFLILVLYDNISLANNYLGMICETEDYLKENLDIKDMGKVTFVIRIEIYRNQSRGLLRLSQEIYIKTILKRFNIESCKTQAGV